MSEADAQPASKAAKKPFDVSVLFATCGVLFSLLIFLFMLKQERENVIQQFNADMSYQLADFQLALSNNIQKPHAVQTSLSMAPAESAVLQQLNNTVTTNPLLNALVWVPASGATVWSDESEASYASVAEVQGWVADPEQRADNQFMVAELNGASTLLYSYPETSSGNLIAIMGVVTLIENSLSDSIDPNVVLKILESDGSLLYSSGDMVVAEDAIFNQALSGDIQWVLSYAASEDYLSDKMSFMPGLFLLIGLFLSFSIASYMKKLLRTLAMLREEQDVLAQQVLDANWNDPLTGLANRVHFDETLDIECRRAVRDFSPLSMMVVEIDQYSELVASVGEQGADVTLQKIAKELQSCVTRPGDLIARTDDYQFSFILPSTNEMVTYLAERCLQAVQTLQLPHDSSSVASVITISAGLVTMQPSKDLTPERLMGSAVEQMQKAQESGGNQYISFAEHGLEPGVTYSV